MADGDLVLIPTDEDHEFLLGRSVIWHDPRNRQFRALDRIGDLPPKRKEPWYRGTPPFDQEDSNCTMEAAVGLLRTQPHTRSFRPHWPQFDQEYERIAAYKRSQELDPWEGTNYDGTSTDAPFKYLRNIGAIKGWSWLFGINEVRTHVQHLGAVVVGTYWKRSMSYPDARARLVVPANDPIVGGHAYELIHFYERTREYLVLNSWGSRWGRRGMAYMHEDLLNDLLEDQGEAVTVQPGMVALAA